jgi:hypothetical protein
MFYMRRLSINILASFSFICAVSAQVGIYEGQLQSDLNASGFSLTNVSSLLDTNGNSLIPSTFAAANIIGAWPPEVVTNGTLLTASNNLTSFVLSISSTSSNGAVSAAQSLDTIVSNGVFNAAQASDIVVSNALRALRSVTNVIPMSGEYPDSSGGGLSAVYSTGMRAKALASVYHTLNIAAPTGYRTNITRLGFITTNTSPGIVLFTNWFMGGSSSAPVANGFSRSITGATAGQTNFVTVSFTNTTVSAWTDTIQQITFIGTSAAANVFYMGGTQEWYP